MNRLRTLLLLLCVCLASSAIAEKKVIGKLGQALEAAPIYSSMSTHGRVYYHVQPYEYLVLQTTPSSKWLRVLMQNMMYGYIRTDAVAKLPYQVTADVASQRNAAIGSRGGATVARNAMNYIGTPYVWGGNDPVNGIDCSGFVKQMYGQIGVNLPRTAAEQVNVGEPITRLQDLQPGDRLYFWEAKRGKIGHTGIYLGKGYFVHSSMGHHGVATDYLGSKKWLNILVAARR